METPKGLYTIAEAAELWIDMIQEAPKATAEQKATLISQVRIAAPQAIGIITTSAAGRTDGSKSYCFTDATNAIKAVIRGEAKR